MFLTGGGVSIVHAWGLTLVFILPLLKHFTGVMITHVLSEYSEPNNSTSTALWDLVFTHSTAILEPICINLIKMLSSVIHLW